MKITKVLGAIAVAAVVALSVALIAPVRQSIAQTAGQIFSVNPLTRDLGALKTLSALTPQTVVTADQNGFNVSRVICVYNQTAHTSSPVVTTVIQNKDAASGAYYTLLSSANITADNVPTPISVGAGLVNSSNVSAAVPIARTWRVVIGVTGSGSATGTLGCSVQ